MKISISKLRQIIKEAVGELSKWPSWEELSEKERIASTYSDVYKEKHGIRPRWMEWDKMTDEEAQAELDRLYDEPADDDPWDDLELDEPPFEMAGDVTNVPPDPREELDISAPPGKIPMKGGNEYDALSHAAKGLHTFRAGERKTAKKSYNRRLRKALHLRESPNGRAPAFQADADMHCEFKSHFPLRRQVTIT